MEGGAAASPTVSVRAGVQGWSGERDTFGSGDKPEDSTVLPVPSLGVGRWTLGIPAGDAVGGSTAWEGGREGKLAAGSIWGPLLPKRDFTHFKEKKG